MLESKNLEDGSDSILCYSIYLFEKMKNKLWMAIVPLMLVGCAKEQQLPEGQVMTQQGILEGEVQEQIVVYRGVPFAAAPVGDLRWKEPQPAESWEGVREAKTFGNDPMQPNLFGDMNFMGPKRSEDCLYLNIWAPRQAEKCPVLIYFNGGGLMAGSGSEPRYAGDSLAHHGVISITANYREGIFGFLAHPDLTAESPNHTSGNYGILDQVAAIQWVKDNIAAFGGDPDKITIAGESAGSFSVSVLMASPLSRGNLAGCIGSSGAELKPSYACSLEDAEIRGAEMVGRFGSIAELRALSADSLQSILPPRGMSTIAVDGYLLDKTVDEIFAANEQAQVPLLAGWNSMEGNPAGAGSLKNYKIQLSGRFGEHVDEVLEAFDIKSDDDLFEWNAIELAGAMFTAFPTWKWCELHKASGQPVYRYFYVHPRPSMVEAMKDMEAGLAGGVKKKDPNAKPVDPRVKVGAVHSADIEYAMGNLATNLVYAWTEDDKKVEQTFMHAYINFVKTGNPNGECVPEWHSITGQEVAPVMQIDVESHEVVNPVLESRYQLLDRVLE